MRRRISIFLLIIFLGSAITGCNYFSSDDFFDESEIKENEIEESEETIEYNIDENGENLRETVLYYLNKEGDLIPYVKNIPWVEGIARATVNKLINNKEVQKALEDTQLKPVLNEGTEVLGLTIRDGNAKIDLNESFLFNKNKSEEENAVNSVLYTLTEFETIERVQFVIEGEMKRELPYGTYVGKPLDRE